MHANQFFLHLIEPPVPAQLHLAPSEPSEADIEVRSIFPFASQILFLTLNYSLATGLKRYLTCSRILKQF